MSFFNLHLALEVAILAFIVLFTVGLLLSVAWAIFKCKREVRIRQNPPDSTNHIRRRKPQISVIEISSEIGGVQRGLDVSSSSTYVHCPSPNYEPHWGNTNEAFRCDESDFINVIVTF